MIKAKDIEIKKLLLEISSWDDWYKLEEELFDLESWPGFDLDEIDKMLNRETTKIDGVFWSPTCTHYDVERELEFKYEKLRELVFQKLEPEGAKNNAAHPEWYGKLCVPCSMWTRQYSANTCGKCGCELVLFPLNED